MGIGTSSTSIADSLLIFLNKGRNFTVKEFFYDKSFEDYKTINEFRIVPAYPERHINEQQYFVTKEYVDQQAIGRAYRGELDRARQMQYDLIRAREFDQAHAQAYRGELDRARQMQYDLIRARELDQARAQAYHADIERNRQYINYQREYWLVHTDRPAPVIEPINPNQQSEAADYFETVYQKMLAKRAISLSHRYEEDYFNKSTQQQILITKADNKQGYEVKMLPFDQKLSDRITESGKKYLKNLIDVLPDFLKPKETKKEL